MPPTLDLLNSKSLGFDKCRRLLYQVSNTSIRGFRHRATHIHSTLNYIHIMTKSSQYRRRRTTYVVGSAVITLSVCALWLPTCHHCRIDSVISVLCMASPSAVALATDFNIHVDDSTDIDAGKLHDVIASHSLHQHVTSPTHTQGHTLDLVITHDNQSEPDYQCAPRRPATAVRPLVRRCWL